MVVFSDRFTTLKIHFDACLRLAKLFKLDKLLDEFNKNLYFLNRRVVKKETKHDGDRREGGGNKVEEGNGHGDRDGDEEEEEELKLSQFDVNAAARKSNNDGSTQLTINDTDIFRNIQISYSLKKKIEILE